MMKIIFLDIDGVLNSDTDFTVAARNYDPVHSKLQKGEKWKIINAGMLSLLNQIVQETGAKIVLSSTWRKHCDAKVLTKIFKRYGGIWTHTENVIVGETKDLTFYKYRDHALTRAEEIMKYVRENDIEEYIILDDLDLDKNAYQSIHVPEDRLIKTDPFDGLNIVKANLAMKELGRTPKYEAKFKKRFKELLMWAGY